MNKTILCVIPLYNTISLQHWNNLNHSIESILNEQVNCDILLINNASQDNTKEIIENYLHNKSQIILIDNPFNNGSAGAFSQGICFAKDNGYKHVYLIDQDSLFSAESILKISDAGEQLKNEYTILCSAVFATENRKKYLSYFRVHFNRFLCYFYSHKEKRDAQFQVIDAGGNTGLFINLAQIGDYNMDESFFYHMEDYDFCLKVQKIKPIYLIPNSIIYHPDKYPEPFLLKRIISNLFIVVLVKKSEIISFKDRNTIKVYKRHGKGFYLGIKVITSCIIAFLSPKYSYKKTKEALLQK